MVSKGLQMGVLFSRSTTAVAKFGQGPENGPRHIPGFVVGMSRV